LLADAETKLDLRTVAPNARVTVATYTSHLLRPGQTMEITDEYDPVDLFVDFQRKSDAFSWDYLERGPKLWRVRVTRMQQPSTTDAALAAHADRCSSPARNQTPDARGQPGCQRCNDKNQRPNVAVLERVGIEHLAPTLVLHETTESELERQGEQ
jgi:uncharacterized protein (DUF2249 family)